MLKLISRGMRLCDFVLKFFVYLAKYEYKEDKTYEKYRSCSASSAVCRILERL